MNSYKVFFENRFIVVSNEPDRMQKYTLFYKYHNCEDLHVAISSFERNSEAISMNIYGTDIEHIWNEFVSYFTFTEAAGGLVENSSGRFLFIVRNNRWDLPKGHIDEGESYTECALREVSEECGIEGQTIVNTLPPSFHTWIYEGVSYLKKTHWFKMSYSGEGPLTPNEEEGITEAKWLTPDDICIIRDYAWDSLTDIINHAIRCS